MPRSVRTRFGRVYVAQTVVDELSQDIYGRQLFAKGQGFVGIRDGRYFFEEVPPEAIQRGMTFLEDLRAWILRERQCRASVTSAYLGPGQLPKTRCHVRGFCDRLDSRGK